MQRAVKFRSRGILHTPSARPGGESAILMQRVRAVSSANEIGMATRGEGWDTSSLRATHAQACV